MGAPRLEGKVVVVTGGGSGLGRACALRMAEEGAAALVVADLDAGAAARVADEVTAATTSEASAFVVDVADEEACQALADHVLRAHHRVDVLVAAAGISGHALPGGTSAVRGSYDAWRRVLAVNLDGVLLTNRAIARVMIDTGGGGSIVNITSMCSAWTSGGATPYAVSKAGAWTLTKCLALELAPHQIRVNAVGPGFIETPMTAATRADKGAFDDIARRTPMKRFGLPTEIANAVLFLASDESSFVTGEILYADGGFNAPSR